MRLGIDLKPFSTGSKYRGIGMYARGLIRELQQHEGWEFHFLDMYGCYDGDPELRGKSILHQYNMGPQIVDVGVRQLFRDECTKNLVKAATEHFLEQSQIDAMLFPSPHEYGGLYEAEWFCSIFKIGIVYDVIPLLFPEQCLFDITTKKDYERALRFLRGMDLLLANSQTTKKDIVRCLGIPEEKIVVIYAGIDECYKRLEKVAVKPLKEKYGISNPFIMFAGGIDFKKNIEDLIAAYARCGKSVIKRYQLVIVGKTAQNVADKYLAVARECGVGERVICAGFVPLEDLVALYNIAELLVFPSLYEGFGLPVIEAMACGTRVLTSNVSSMKELAEGHATLVDPESVKSIANGIQSVFARPIETLQLAESSIPYAKTFTWKAVAKRTVEAIEQHFVNKEKKPRYEFSVTESLVRNMARLYAEYGLPFDSESQNELADELLCIERHEAMPSFNGAARLLFDMTVVRGWLKNAYTTGIGRVSWELYKELKRKLPVIPVSVSKEQEQAVLQRIDLSDCSVLDERIAPRQGDIFFMPEIQLRGVQVAKDHPYAQALRVQGVKTAAVIYDILPLRFPQYFEKPTCAAFDPYVRELVWNYDSILADSRFVADDILAYCDEHNILLKANKNIKFGWFHLGQNTFEGKCDKTVSIHIQRFFGEGQKTFAMIGTIEPRKGQDVVLTAFEKIWAQGSESRLCIVGNVGWNMGAFIGRLKQHAELGSRLAFFEAVNDAELKFIYEHIDCLIQASAGEGFGLPLIEAGNYGIPLLCSDIPVFHEVAGDNAVYFDRENQENVIRAISDFEDGIGVKDSSKIEKTSWKDAAEKVYGMLVEDRGWYKEL